MKCAMGVAIQAGTNAKNQQAREHLAKPGALRFPPAYYLSVPNAFNDVNTKCPDTHLGIR